MGWSPSRMLATRPPTRTTSHSLSAASRSPPLRSPASSTPSLPGRTGGLSLAVMPDPPVAEGARLPVDPLAAELGERFHARGFELYLVGGVVRARFLGQTGPELDFATD